MGTTTADTPSPLQGSVPTDIVGRATFPRWMQRAAIAGLGLFVAGLVLLWPISILLPVAARLLPLGIMVVGGSILCVMAVEARRRLAHGSEQPVT